MKIVVTGASGWIGRAICGIANNSGHAVVALGRKQRVGPWEEYVSVDLAHNEAVTMTDYSALAGAAVMIHCAGYAHRPSESPDTVARFQEVNVEGTRHGAEIARRAGIPKVLYLSSIAFYDWSKGTGFDEDGPVAPLTAYAASKLEGEAVIRNCGLDWRIARLGTIFGDGDRANFLKLSQALADRRFILPGAGDARKSVMPINLAANVLLEYALMTDVDEKILNIALPNAPTLGHICEAFSDVCGYNRPRSMPMSLMRGVARVGDMLDRVKLDFPLTSKNMIKLTTSTTVNVSRMMKMMPSTEWQDFSWWLERSKEHYIRVCGR